MRTPIYSLLLAAAGALAAPAATLVLNNGALSGLPASTVGWGFTITTTPVLDGGNPITPWLLITFADFQPDPGINPVGVFTAFITQLPNSNTVVGPDAGNGEINPWAQAFDPVLLTGIGSYQINDFQSAGDSVTGTVILFYDEFRTSPNDPAFNPDNDTIAIGQSLTASASVNVTGVPEPGSLSMLLLAACAFAGVTISKIARKDYRGPCRSTSISTGGLFAWKGTRKPRCSISCAPED